MRAGPTGSLTGAGLRQNRRHESALITVPPATLGGPIWWKKLPVVPHHLMDEVEELRTCRCETDAPASTGRACDLVAPAGSPLGLRWVPDLALSLAHRAGRNLKILIVNLHVYAVVERVLP